MHNIYFFTDVHGYRPLFDAVIDYCFKEDDEPTIIFGGDAIDRGEDGYSIMKDILANPYIIYLKGNHEDMFVKAAKQIRTDFDFAGCSVEQIYKMLGACYNTINDKHLAIQLVIHNGGLDTLVDWVVDGMPMDIVERINSLPYTFSYEQYDFCHAGGVYPAFKRVNDCEYNNSTLDERDTDFLLWDRHSFEYGWEPNRVCIHGHTPTRALLKFLNRDYHIPAQPLKYSGDINPRYTGGKIDMDTSVANTETIFVLNVLTQKAQGFELEKNGQVRQIETIQL